MENTKYRQFLNCGFLWLFNPFSMAGGRCEENRSGLLLLFGLPPLAAFDFAFD